MYADESGCAVQASIWVWADVSQNVGNVQCCQKWRDHAKVASLDPSVASKNLKWREPAKVEKCGVF